MPLPKQPLILLLATFAVLAQPAPVSEWKLPNGRAITPLGEWLKLAPYPFALAVRSDGKQVVAPSVGFPFALNIIDGPGSAEARVTRVPDSKKSAKDVEVHAGVVYSPDGKLLYDATGDSGAVDVLSTATWTPVTRIALDGDTSGVKYSGSFAAALALSPDGRWLYALDQGNWRVVVIETASGARVTQTSTGSNPFAVARSPDGKRLYVTNSGLFEYKRVEGIDQKDVRNTGLHFPPFGYPSKQAREGARVEGHAVPGLGDENDVRGSSLWTYDLTDATRPALLAKLRLGNRIRGKSRVVGGASPTGVLADERHVYVTLAHKDEVAVITADGKRIEREIALTPFTGRDFEDVQGHALRGVMPAGMAQDAKRLFVTEAGINAVAVIEKDSGKVLGHLPAGWYPSAAGLAPDGRTLYVVNTKGKGAGPNGGSTLPADAPGNYIGQLMFGSLSSIALGADTESKLADATAVVVRNNRAALGEGAQLPRLKHVFLIVRENRTFDEVFGDLPGANGDATLARFGMHGWAEEESEHKGYRVTPNAHALAKRFATSDAFSVDSDVSADGHRWAMGAAPTPWMNLAWTTGYGDRRKGNPFSDAPGRRALGGGADAPMPEDEPEFGMLWEHFAGSGLSIRNYGEGLELEGSDEGDGMEPEGQRLVLNSPVPQPVYLSSDRKFPTFNLGIPDQMRYDEFAKDFGALVAKGRAPALTVIRLPNDHMTEPRRGDGYPFRVSYVADNDLALGRIIEWISRSSIWKDSAVFVIEDDAQGGMDHVDAHRSVLLVASPYARKGYISHRAASMPSVQKTMYQLLGLGPLNLEDALAANLSDAFTDIPDLTPYRAEESDTRIFDPKLAKVARPKTAAEARALLDMDNPRVIAEEMAKLAKLAKKKKE